MGIVAAEAFKARCDGCGVSGPTSTQRDAKGTVLVPAVVDHVTVDGVTSDVVTTPAVKLTGDGAPDLARADGWLLIQVKDSSPLCYKTFCPDCSRV